MRILLVSDVSSRMPGGVPAETARLIEGLAGRNHEVALAADAPLPSVRPAAHFPISVPVTTALAAEVAHAVEAFRPDVVHVMCMSSKGLLRLGAVLDGRAWLLTVHSVPPYERKLAGWHRRERIHYALRALRFGVNGLAWRLVFRRVRIPLLIVHSVFVRDIVVRYGFPTRRIRSLFLDWQGAEKAGVRDVAPAPQLVTVAGFAHSKGQHDAIRALPALVERWPRLVYRLFGEVRDESYLRFLRALVGELGLADHVQITINAPRSALMEALQQADLYVQPSHEEGFCLAYLEAAARVPRLVGTAVGAIAAVSEGDIGARVVPARSPPSLGRAIAELLSAPLPADAMAVRERRLSAAFSREAYLDAHERAYGEAAGRAAGRGDDALRAA